MRKASPEQSLGGIAKNTDFDDEELDRAMLGSVSEDPGVLEDEAEAMPLDEDSGIDLKCRDGDEGSEDESASQVVGLDDKRAVGDHLIPPDKRRAEQAKKPPLQSLKRTAKEMLSLLQKDASADSDTRRNILNDLKPRLRQLREDLSTTGKSVPGMDRLAELLRQLEGDLVDDAVVRRLWAETEEVLKLIVGKSWWKFWA
jgi:hypothetical protein